MLSHLDRNNKFGEFKIENHAGVTVPKLTVYSLFVEKYPISKTEKCMLRSFYCVLDRRKICNVITATYFNLKCK